MAAPRALVTGATGFVGTHVARLLLEKGRTVRVLVRPDSDPRNLPSASDLEIRQGDLRDAASVHQAVQGCDEVYHVAADYRFWSRDPRELYESNVHGTRNMLEASLRAGVSRFIHTSTVGTIGLSHSPRPCDENTPSDPGQWESHYKRSKHEAENLALDYHRRGLPVVVVNPSTPIGACDRKPTPTGKIIVDFLNGRLPAYVQTGLNFVHVRDVACGHLLAAERGRLGERYILGHVNLPMIRFLELLASASERRAPRIRIPYALAHMAGRISTLYADWISGKAPSIPLEAVKMSRRHMYFDSSKAIRELGLPQTPVRAAATEAIEWFLAQGFVKD